MTGVTTQSVLGARHFKDEIHAFIGWCGEEDYTVVAWSKSDKAQIEKEIKLKKIPVNENFMRFLSNWEDFQERFDNLVESKHPIALEKALNMC